MYIPLYTDMAWCLIMHKDKFTFTFYNVVMLSVPKTQWNTLGHMPCELNLGTAYPMCFSKKYREALTALMFLKCLYLSIWEG
jgi:hypothetical protein